MKSRQSTLSHWQAHFSAQSRSGLSIKSYCEQHNLKRHQFTYYRNRMRKQKTCSVEPKLVPVVVASQKVLKVRINGIPFEFEGPISPRWMAELLHTMGELR